MTVAPSDGKRLLGRTSLKVCPIALGTIPLARLPKDEAVKLIRYALKEGVDFIDTARAYGPAEEYVGAALENLESDVVVATKSMARKAEELRQELITSLQNLKRDKVEVFFLHQVDTFPDIEQITAEDGALSELLKARDEGLVDYIGLSGHFTPVLAKAVEDLPLDILLGRFNLTMTEDEHNLIQKAREKDISIASMKVIEGGFVTRHTDLALRFALHGPDVDLVMIGCESKKQIDENLEALCNSKALTAAELAQINQSAQELREEAFCSYCGYCTDGCPLDLPISHVFNLQGKLNVFGSQYGFAGSPGAAMYLRDFVGAIDACNDCGICEERCPNSLPIRKLLKERKAQFQKCLQEDGKPLGDS